jgi:hypothetical protein
VFSAFFRGKSISGFLHFKFTRILRSSLMHWIAPKEKDADNATPEKRHRAVADQFQSIIQNLRRTRNLMLPRLLAGQVNLRTN